MKITGYKPSSNEDVMRVEFDRLDMQKDLKAMLEDPKFQKFLDDNMLTAGMSGDAQLQVKAMLTSPQRLVYCVDTESSVVLINTKYRNEAYGIFGMATGGSLGKMLADYSRLNKLLANYKK